jgi:hypothetical protein
MTAFTKGEPTQAHHFDRDPELLIDFRPPSRSTKS